MGPMINASATRQSVTEEPNQPYHHVKMQLSGIMVTVKVHLIPGTRTSERFASVDVKSECLIRRRTANVRSTQDSGNVRVDITDALYQFAQHSEGKQRCLGAQVIFGGKLRRRKFDNQATELFIKCAVLNRMIQDCKPESYKVEL